MTEWCDKHNIEKIEEHCPECDKVAHEEYIKKWKDVDKQRKKEEGNWFWWV